MDDFGPDIATVVDEDGTEHEFEVLDRIETDDNNKYVALSPYYANEADMLNDAGDLFILRVSEENGDTILEPIEDEAEFDEISDIFKQRLSELYDIKEDTDEDNSTDEE